MFFDSSTQRDLLDNPMTRYDGRPPHALGSLGILSTSSAGVCSGLPYAFGMERPGFRFQGAPRTCWGVLGCTSVRFELTHSFGAWITNHSVKVGDSRHAE